MVCKAANPTAMASSVSSPLDPSFVAHERIKQDAAQHIVALPLTMLALGALTRGALGVRDLLMPAHLPRNPSRLKAIPMPGRPAEEEEKLAEEMPTLDAGDHLTPQQPGNFALRMIQPISSLLYKHLMAATPDQLRQSLSRSTMNLPEFWRGDYAQSVAGVPATGLAIPLGVAGLAAGYGGVDKMLDVKQDTERQHELKQLRDQFQAEINKSAADAFEALAVARIKEAQPTPAPATPVAPVASPPIPTGSSWGRAGWEGLGHMTALQNAIALTLALGAGKFSYDYFKERSKRKVLDEAMKRRATARNTLELTPAYVAPMS